MALYDFRDTACAGQVADTMASHRDTMFAGVDIPFGVIVGNLPDDTERRVTNKNFNRIIGVSARITTTEKDGYVTGEAVAVLTKGRVWVRARYDVQFDFNLIGSDVYCDTTTGEYCLQGADNAVKVDNAIVRSYAVQANQNLKLVELELHYPYMAN